MELNKGTLAQSESESNECVIRERRRDVVD